MNIARGMRAWTTVSLHTILPLLQEAINYVLSAVSMAFRAPGALMAENEVGGSRVALSLPPGDFGLPYLGDSLPIVSHPYEYSTKRRAQYGTVFKTRFLGNRAVVLLSDEAQQYILVSHQKNFSNAVGYRPFVPFLGNSLITTDDPLHSTQRKLMTPAFHMRTMAGYLERMNRVIETQLASWGASGRRLFYPEGRQMAFSLITSLLLGDDVSHDYQRLNALWKDFEKGPLGIFRIDTPLTAFGRAMTAKRKLDVLLRRHIQKRRIESTDDALGLLVSGTNEEGNAFDEDQLVEQARLLMFAGYDTTSGTVSWALAELLRQPDLLERVRAEINADSQHDAPLTMDDIRQKPLLDAVIQETLRLHAQLALLARGAIEPFEFQGFTIPAGWLVILVPAYTQRMAEYFTEPERFDPDRFLAPRQEDKQHPYAWIGFGGGGHSCLGEAIAKMEIKAVLTRLLRRYDLQLVPGQDLTPLYVPLNRPKGEVMIAYQARI